MPAPEHDLWITLRIPRALLVEALALAASAHVEQRCRELSIEELATRWGCTSRKETLRLAASRGVPVLRDRGRKNAYVMLADVEAAHARLRKAAAGSRDLPSDVRLTTFRAESRAA